MQSETVKLGKVVCVIITTEYSMGPEYKYELICDCVTSEES